MEFCGGHTVSIFKHGIRQLLPQTVEMLSGPGCPVCVTANEDLDKVISLSRLPDVIITTFGDLLRVPGSYSSLQQARAEGSDIRVVYSTLEALDIALTDPILPAAMEALVGLAELLMQGGEMCRASEMIAQVMNHPASSQQSRDKAKRLWLALETQFSTDQLESLMTTASCQSLQMIAAHLQNSHTL